MTTLPVSDRFFAVGITDLLWVPAIAATTGIPTRPELTAGTKLQDEVVDATGWNVEPNSFNVDTLGTRVSPSMTGRLRMSAASITFAASLDGEDIRTVLEDGDQGFIVWADGGDVTGYAAEAFPVTVANVSPVRTIAEQEHRIVVSFSITNVPVKFPLPATTP